MPSDQRVNFVVLFQGRAGSSYLTDVLDRHPDITASGEWLAGLLEGEDERGDSVLARLRSAGRRLVRGCPTQRQLHGTRAFFGERRPGTRVAGFKTKVRDLLEPARIAEILVEADAKVIVMRRENLVKQAVSRLNAARLHARTRRWNRRQGEEPLGSFSVSPATFSAHLAQVVFDQRVLDAFADLLDAPRLELEYADLLRDREGWFGSVYDFLEVEPRPIESDVLKNTRDDLRRVLTNFDELRNAYRGTRFEPMFDETVGSAP